MKTRSIDSVMVSGAVAALLAVSGARIARAQAAAPVRQIAKDTTIVLRFDGATITLDSVRGLIRAFDVQPLSSRESARMREELDQMAIAFKMSLLGSGQRIFITGGDGPARFWKLPAKGWIGITTGGVHNDWMSDGHLVQYLDYPPIVAVERRSPAQVAGILPGDTLVAYDGVDVVAHPINVSQLLMPEKKIAVTVRRYGENKAFSLVVARPPNTVFSQGGFSDEGPEPPFPPVVASRGPTTRIVAGGFGRGPGSGQVFVFATGVFGASLSSAGQDLAKKLKIEPGVLVNEVPDDTPAARAGLEAGDVIVSVEGQPVTTVEDVRRIAVLRGENHAVTLQVIRDKKSRSIIVK